MSTIEFDDYANNLLVTVAVCQNTLKILEKLKSEHNGLKFAGSGTVEAQISQRIAEFLVIKLYCLFDKRSGTLSLENIKNQVQGTTDSGKAINLHAEYSKIRNQHHNLIERIRRNRNAGIAHILKDGGLGWDESSLEMFKGIWSDQLKDMGAVSDDRVYLTYWNFPVDEVKKILTDLKESILGVLLQNTSVVKQNDYRDRF